MAGAVVSAVLHFAIATGFVRWSRLHGLEIGVRESPEQRRAEAPPRPAEQQQPRKPIIRLGIDRSEASTLTWLGFETPTEHDGVKSSIEQSAMSPAPPGPPAASQPEPSPPAPPQPETATPEPQPPAPTPPVEASATQEVLQGVRQTAAAITEAGKQLAAAAEDLAALLEKVPQPPAPSAPGPDHPDPAAPVRRDENPQTQVQAPPAQRPQPPQPTPPSPAAQAKGADGAPGIRADKESMATAIKKSPTARPDGRVVAAQGLEIQTRRPRWEYTTMITRRPRNPTVVITFRADGTVKSAEFARDSVKVYNSGYADVDEPLISAIYSWTAKGKALKEATQEGPDGTVTIMMTIILTG